VPPPAGLRAVPGAVPGVRSVFQPIVELDSGLVVGYEALTRGPGGEPPLPLFDAARREGRLTEFDRSCRDLALARAVAGGVAPPLTVFVNVEPTTLDPDDPTWREAPEDLRCVIEITERALTDRPAELLHAVAAVREQSWGVALDDVGADQRSLALMALLRPDVIKLDLRLVQQRPDREIAEVVAAVNAQAEETGAVVLAEGIETEEHELTALAMGATLGQGYRFGRPGDLPAAPPDAASMVRFLGSDLHAHGPTPFELVRRTAAMRRGTFDLLRTLTEHLEAQALGLGSATVVLAARPAERFSPAGLVPLAAQASLVGLVGAGRDGMPFRTGEGADVTDEATLVVLSPHFAAALVARRLGDAGYEFTVTHRRELVAACARSLAARLAPAG
jgi:EAL domain-containing protein (putative c-di-GMP-specific phosphodiesterase class I)